MNMNKASVIMQDKANADKHKIEMYDRLICIASNAIDMWGVGEIGVVCRELGCTKEELKEINPEWFEGEENE